MAEHHNDHQSAMLTHDAALRIVTAEVAIAAGLGVPVAILVADPPDQAFGLPAISLRNKKINGSCVGKLARPWWVRFDVQKSQ